MVPGVSRSSKPAQRIHCFPRVTPALSPVIARFAPLKALMTVLLPVLGMPATISLSGRRMPFSSSFLCFSESMEEIFAPTRFAAEESVAQQMLQLRRVRAALDERAKAFRPPLVRQIALVENV